jgi:endonuclease/exonuclease/phosphatase family metal-dependent hydrolase
MGGLRVLTYNTQCRSWGMEAGAQGRLDPVTSVEDRAGIISDRILGGSQQYDIVCLMEVFDEDARQVFTDRLGPRYPNAVLKADAGSPAEGALVVTAAAIPLLTVPVIGWLAALGVGLLELPNLTAWEDSGLMMFSRLPFDHIPTPPPFAQLGVPQVPVVAYAPYGDRAGNDAFAAKGVVYSRLILPGNRPLHLLFTHTQADSTTGIGEHADVRVKQFQQVWTLLTGMAGGPPFKEEVLFCGDFNVNGLKDPGGARPEWTALFNSPASHFTKELFDPWVHEQRAQDLAHPGQPLPIEDPGATTHQQRLDYMLRTGPSPSFPARLATQHMAIAFDIAQASGSAAPNAYTSDHLPLRIDLNMKRDHNTVWTAEPLVFGSSPDVIAEGVVTEGEMHWYRIDRQGGYGIALTAGPPNVAFEVYTPDNFSVPMLPFTTTAEPAGPELPPLTRYALPTAPFFIRVFPVKRTGEAFYRLQVHRYLGREPGDAIPLIHGIPTQAEMQVGTYHSLDRPETPFDDQDGIWFVTRFDKPPKTRPFVTTTVTVDHPDERVFGIIVAQRDGAGNWHELGEVPPGGPPVVLPVEQKERTRGYVVVKRDDPTFTAHRFDIGVTSDASYLYPLAADPSKPGDEDRQGIQEGYVFCEDETDNVIASIPLLGDIVGEFGSDDIAINFSAGGQNLVHVPNSDDLEFDDDTKRALTCPTIRYGGDAEIELVEEDDLSPSDRTSIPVPQWPASKAAAFRIVSNGPISAFVTYRLSFDGDDGIYYVALTVSCEPPPVP